VKHSSPFVPGFVRSKMTPRTKLDETLLRGGFVPGFVPDLGTFIGNRFRHHSSLVSSLRGKQRQILNVIRPMHPARPRDLILAGSGGQKLKESDNLAIVETVKNRLHAQRPHSVQTLSRQTEGMQKPRSWCSCRSNTEGNMTVSQTPSSVRSVGLLLLVGCFEPWWLRTLTDP
jgi:hypothetical protein